jgi:hypothetical protein
MSRKRRRSQAIPAEEECDEERTSDDTAGDEHDPEERRKELEIWDAFKEEHHESASITIILIER